MSAPVPPPSFDTATLVDHYDLRFDAGDPLNGSLYVCTPRGAALPPRLITGLRAAGLWSAEAEKLVAEDQRPAYRAGLEFVAAVAYACDGGHFVLARFDHPRFPSDAARYAAWLAHADAHHERVG